MLINCLYDYYESGYYNGIQFAYIPDNLTPIELKAWEEGYKDAKNNEEKKDIDIFKKERENESNEDRRARDSRTVSGIGSLDC